MAAKVFEIANEVQAYVNSFYDIFANKVFNIKTHRFKIKQELVAKTGFWQRKKRYALWIISDKGLPVDKLDVKGLDVVRSSFPKSFQVFMKKVLIDILKGTDRDEIDQSILNFKSNLSAILYNEVAKVSSIGDIRKYETPIKDEVLGKYVSGTPSHIKGAINYNKLLQTFKCSGKYATIKNGEKVKIVYLKDNSYGLKELAFRGDGDPIEILNFIKENIDVVGIFNAELDKKLKAFYSAMNWTFPSEHTKNAAKFFSF